MIRTLALVLVSNFMLLSAGLSAQNSDFLMDERDGNVYLVAKFKDTWWMCQNLKYDAGEGSACYNDDETNCMLEGRLYDQAAAMKVCPQGYHLPTDEEWKDLESYMGMDKDELDKVHSRNSGEIGKYLRVGGGIGFDAAFVGMISPRGNSVQSGVNAYFWSSTEENGAGWVRVISKNSDGVERKMIDSRHKLSVRCVKQGQPDPD
ncbi:MAG: FISUMP domain-containing protein [Bacteroidales bacterium]|jgi:uncharacterized protein (TIGR02145 family)|nr:FISUMP domain-containing protein [Bacteroidales bacterium]